MRGSLATQLRLGLAAAFVLVLAISAVIWWVARSSHAAIEHVYNTELHNAIQLAEAESALWQLHLGLDQFILGSDEERERILVEQDRWYTAIEERLVAYGNAAHEAEERHSLTTLRSTYQRYKQARPKFFELWQTGEKEEALAWRALTTTPFGTETARAFETQIAEQRSFIEREGVEAVQNARVQLTLVAVTIIALLGLLAAGYAYALRMLRPIRALRARAEATVREQFDETVEASASSNEVVALEKTFQLMSDRLLAHTEGLQRAHARLDFLLHATPAVIYAAKADGDYGATFISANIREQLGHAPEDFLNDSGFWVNNIHPEDRERVLAHQAFLFTEGRITSEYRFRHKDGAWRWMHDETILARDAAGEPKELVGYWLDITSRVVAEKGRERVQERLQAALRLKSEFLNNITHELRTPLNSVIGFAELLKNGVPGPLNVTQAQFTADILASGEHLLKLVEEILEMSRLDAAGGTLAREPVQIGAALEERVAAQRKAVEARRIAIKFDVAPDAGSAMLEPKALRRMLDALIDNAVKFNREGGTVAVSARRAGNWIEIAVADTGIGIAKEDFTKLFQPLVQLDAGLARRHGGVGLGLALARRLAEQHGGTIEVASEPGKGSTFTLRLPLQEQS